MIAGSSTAGVIALSLSSPVNDATLTVSPSAALVLKNFKKNASIL
jgi:hypothetical protein